MQTNVNEGEWAVAFRMKEGSRVRIARCGNLTEARIISSQKIAQKKVVIGIYNRVES